MKKSSITRINQSDLIKEIAEAFPGIYDVKTIRDIVLQMEQTIIDNLASADEEQSVIIIPMKGLALSSKLIPSKEKVSNLTGEILTTEAQIKPKATFSNNFRKNVLNKP